MEILFTSIFITLHTGTSGGLTSSVLLLTNITNLKIKIQSNLHTKG
jgi:hypothetical protein